MKQLILLLVLVIPIQITATELCGSPKKSKEEALASLAPLVKSSFSLQNKTVEIIDGYESSVKDTTIKQLSAELKNAQYVKYKETQDNSIIACIIQKGIYIDMSNSSIKGKIGSHLTKDLGCVLADNSETAVFHLKLDIKECGQLNGTTASHCKACIDIKLHSNENGKSYYTDSFEGKKNSWTNMEEACRRAINESVSEIWNKLKGQINPGDCK